jgi:hypothetical protein
MNNETVGKFIDWFDDKLIKREIVRLKDEPLGRKWFLNTAPDKPEGKQNWIKLTSERLVHCYKNMTDEN